MVHLRIVPPSPPPSLPPFFRDAPVKVRRKGGREGGREGGRVGGRVLVVHHVGRHPRRSRSRAIRPVRRRKLGGKRRRRGLSGGEDRHRERGRPSMGVTRESERESVAGLLIRDLSVVLLLLLLLLLPLVLAFDLPSRHGVQECQGGRGGGGGVVVEVLLVLRVHDGDEEGRDGGRRGGRTGGGGDGSRDGLVESAGGDEGRIDLEGRRNGGVKRAGKESVSGHVKIESAGGDEGRIDLEGRRNGGVRRPGKESVSGHVKIRGGTVYVRQ